MTLSLDHSTPSQSDSTTSIESNSFLALFRSSILHLARAISLPPPHPLALTPTLTLTLILAKRRHTQSSSIDVDLSHCCCRLPFHLTQRLSLPRQRWRHYHHRHHHHLAYSQIQWVSRWHCALYKLNLLTFLFTEMRITSIAPKNICQFIWLWLWL